MEIDFIIPGAPKSATTSIVRILQESPDIYIPPGEPRFFYIDKKYNKGMSSYNKMFLDAHKSMVKGEVSNIYMYSEKAIQRIKKHFPHIKFIVCLRNPSDRAFSQYNYCREKGTEFLSFKTAVRREKFRQRFPHRFFRNNYAYITRGFYSVYLERMLKYFNIDQFHYVLFEDYIKNPKEEIRKILNFLNVDDSYLATLELFKKTNTTKYPVFPIFQLPVLFYHKVIKPRFDNRIMRFMANKINYYNLRGSKPCLSNEDKKSINKLFLSDIKKLEKIINKDLSVWK